MYMANRRRSRRQCAVTDSEWDELKRRAQDAGVSRFVFERLMTEPAAPEPPAALERIERAVAVLCEAEKARMSGEVWLDLRRKADAALDSGDFE